MSTKPTLEVESPSASSLFLPQLRHSRRGSLASLSSTSQVDREILSQALDQIHNAACQSETLTTFNEYTSPPSSSTGGEGKGIASELHGGLSGLYSRIRASVGNVRDIVTLTGDDGPLDEASLKSSGSALPSPAPSTRQYSDSIKHSNPTGTISNPNPRAGKERQISLEYTGIDKAVRDSGRYSRPAKLPLGTASASSKATLPSISVPRSPLAPFTQVAQLTAITPTVAEVNISAMKERSLIEDTTMQNTHMHSVSSPRLVSYSRQEDHPDEILETHSTAAFGSDPVEGLKMSDLDGENMEPQASKSTIDRGSMSSKQPNKQPRDPKEIAEPRASLSGRSVIDEAVAVRVAAADGTSKTGISMIQRLPSTTSIPKDTHRTSTQTSTRDTHFPGIQTASTGGPALELTTELAQGGHHQHLELPSRKQLAGSKITQSPPPDLSLSRASSLESTASVSIDSAMQTATNHLHPVEFEELPTGSTTNSKSASADQYESDPRTMNVFSQIKSKILNKEYWMRDENARDCFYCGDPFSTFRRKHHCRTCGQIFDSKCTSLISGAQFGQSSSLRVCKPCEGIINGYDDSSEYSDDGSSPAFGLRPRHGSTGASDALGSPDSRSRPTGTNEARASAVPKLKSPIIEDVRWAPRHLDLSVPTMAIPATRKAGGESSKITAILESDRERSLLRPSSSRSLKSLQTTRPYSSGHKRHNSRYLNQRNFKPLNEDSAPFHRIHDDKEKRGRLTAFHDDNIIDPDLAPYLSDEESSGDEQISIMSALSGDGTSRSYDGERNVLTGLLGSPRKGRSRAGDKSISGVAFASRDTDNNSLSSSRTSNLPRNSKRRNLGVASGMQLRPSPRSHRASTIIPAFGSHLQESTSTSSLAQVISSNSMGGSRMIRSSSMRGAAAPAVELNNASLHHVRKLLRQLLQDSDVPHIESWEKALIPILLKATDDVNPDVQNGDDIDIRHYVKLKKIPGGRPGDTSYVSGLVFTKNLALKSMPRNLSHPNILILTFPLEYARHQQHFMSLEPVIRQEREFLQNLVSRIVALRPQLLLVERNVSGLALGFLEQANIATAYNVKPSVLEAVSRCTQTRIISSIDKLAIKPAQVGTCESFYLKTYVHKGKRKTYTFLSGCAKELGCTIILRGSNNETLAKMKRITEFMVYVVYNLKLETCLMRDEFALIPSSTGIGSLSPGIEAASNASQTGLVYRGNAPAIASTKLQRSGGVADQASDSVLNADSLGTTERNHVPMPEDVPMPTFYGDMVEEHKTKILSASPFVKFMQPYLLMRAREEERRLSYLKRLRDQDILEEKRVEETVEPQKFELIKPAMIHEEVQAASRKAREVLHALHDAEYDKALHNYETQSKQWEAYIAGNINLFDPYAHQNIAVLYSVVCTVTTTPCSGPDLVALAFYNEHETDADFEADCTLGQYVEDLCLGANTVCTFNNCERKMFDHHRQYVHGEAQLSVFVERYPCKLRGLQQTVLMWSCCRICGKETQVMPMSENTWKYSFGKYLELSFWSSDLRARAGVCPHDLHRDHLRYFGFKDVALRVHYDPITLLEIIVPRARITWKVENDLQFKNELFTKIEDRLNKYMISVKSRIKSIRVETVLPEKTDICQQEVDKLMKRASEEHRSLIRKLQDNYMNSKHYEIIPLNRAIRATQEKVAEWDSAFADFDHNFFPSEKDIRRLATLQLKKIFLDRDDSTTSLTSTDDGSGSSIPEEVVNEKTLLDSTPALTPRARTMSSEKAHDMLTSVVDKDAITSNGAEDEPKDLQQSSSSTSVSIEQPRDKQTALQDLDHAGVRHLDLAMSPEFSDRAVDDQRPMGTGPDFGYNGAEDKQGLSESPTAHEAPLTTAATKPITRDEPSMSGGSASKDFAVLDQSQASGIPRPTEVKLHRAASSVSPPLLRAHSQPPRTRRQNTSSSSQASMKLLQSSETHSQVKRQGDFQNPAAASNIIKYVEKKHSDRTGPGAIKSGGVSAHSMIPRSIASRKKNTQVSTLAKHFEQLSREFERERVRERRIRAAKSRQARAYPLAVSKPIVEIYKNVREAVEEREPSDEDTLSAEASPEKCEEGTVAIGRPAENTDSQSNGDGIYIEDTTAETTETEETNHLDSRVESDADGEGGHSEEDHSLLGDIHIPGSPEEHHALSPVETQLDRKLDLPKHEKSSLMKMLTNFWAERSASGWQPLEYPLNASDHIFADSDIVVREDEPSSLIAFALGSEDYGAKLRSISENAAGPNGEHETSHTQDPMLDTDEQVEVERSLLRSTGTHLKYQFQEGSAKMLCKVFFAEQFDAVRRKCGVAERTVESLSRCLKWDSKGGKTKSVFLKTLDDRFVLKSLSPVETQAFLRFAPAYFRIMSEYLFHELPSVIAKMFGFYQIIIKNPVTGVEFNWFLIVMENLFYDRSPTRIFDLKGSMRNRRIQSTGEQNEVLLDENMVEFIYESPLFSREHSKKLLRASVWNDTLFLSRQNVMDYSLMIAIDENRKELVVGIIDCIRTYTWDKKLESWIKDRGKNRPTVTSPKEYKSRFREAMGRYVLQAPNCWHQFKAQRIQTRPLKVDEKDEAKDAEEAETGVI